MRPRKSPGSRKRKTASPRGKKTSKAIARDAPHAPELVIITGMSGSGKASVLKAFEDLGFYCVDNLPVELVPHFAELSKNSDFERTALVLDIREGQLINKVPEIVCNPRKSLRTTVIFLDTSDEVLVRRFSETRRPHPLGKDLSVPQAIAHEREELLEIRDFADVIIDTSTFTVHQLRAHALEKFGQGHDSTHIAVSCVSFGFKYGVPQDCDLLFDVRFLPNPHFVPELRPFTGLHPKVAEYVRSFPQTQEFIDRISKLLIYLLPHYVNEGKSYLTIGFGCTGGKHRSVMIAQDIAGLLQKAGYNVSVTHRDSPQA